MSRMPPLGRTLWLLLKTARPSQWVKNLFVVAPALFAKAHTAQEPLLVLRGVLAAGVFVLLSGVVYVLNDLVDAPRDRLHPVKRLRPIASGALPEGPAWAGGGLLAVAGLCGAAFFGVRFFAMAVLYLGLNVAYSRGLKEVAWLDVVVIAAGFLVRILAGCFAIGLAVAEVSYFLVACTFLVALFLALGKRRAEMNANNGAEVRAVLGRYRRGHLDVALWVVAVLTVIAYAFYTVSPRTVRYFGHHDLVWTTPFVVLGIARFLWLTRHVGMGKSPTEVMVRDGWFLLNLAAWAATVTWVIYGRTP